MNKVLSLFCLFMLIMSMASTAFADFTLRQQVTMGTGGVTTADGRGLRDARLMLTSPDGGRRTAITSTFGYYAFDGVEVGQTYVMQFTSKRYTFANPTRVFSLQDEVTDMDYTAQPQ